ncbi:acireductone dioxygenase [Pseudomonas sp. CAU 1711]|uniref:acireductone dioxygenase n=1 Tax=Pseudomonas sp. CAU 1711 TaxID=3140356 RepID=UPI00325FECAA
MSSLTVYHQSSPQVPDKMLTHAQDIAATLAEVGAGFERWPVDASIQPGQDRSEVLDALRPQLDELMSGRGYSSVELLSQSRARYRDEPSTEGPEEMRSTAAQGYLLLAGRGLLNLHIGERVFAVLCEKGDLLSIPAGTRYWFDSGEFPHLLALQMATRAAEPTGDEIAGRFPRLDC